MVDGKQKELRSLMRKAKIFEKDIKEDFIRSSGPGGQNVNKVSTCVKLYHVPTGIQVKCQKERTQVMNRYLARELLLRKIEKINKLQQQEKQQALAKKKRQNRKRSRALKEKILEGKKRQSEKKVLRKKVRGHMDD